jgi:ABC-2 type transport system permease protein
MNGRRLIAIARKEFYHVVRDPRSLTLAVGIPALLMVLFGYALTLDVDKVPLVILDRSRTDVSRDFTARFTSSHYFAVDAYADSYAEIERAIDERKALGALVIPSDFADRVAAGRAADAQFIVDGSDSTTASIALGYAEVVVASYSAELAVRKFLRMGAREIAAPVDFRARVWYNPEMESKNYIIPGLIAIIMMIIAALITSLTVSREWERGTMEQLISTPVTGAEVVLGKLIPYFGIGMADVALAVVLGEFVFNVPLRGNVALLFIVAAVFLVGALSMGMLISILTRNQLLSNQLAMVITFLPTFLLSGLIFPIANMPVVVQAVTYLVPARYFVTLLKDIYMKGLGVEAIGVEALMLAVFSLLMLFLCVAAFKKRVA